MAKKPPPEGDEEVELASPPCSLAEIDPLYAGIAPAGAKPRAKKRAVRKPVRAAD